MPPAWKMFRCGPWVISCITEQTTQVKPDPGSSVTKPLDVLSYNLTQSWSLKLQDLVGKLQISLQLDRHLSTAAEVPEVPVKFQSNQAILNPYLTVL